MSLQIYHKKILMYGGEKGLIDQIKNFVKSVKERLTEKKKHITNQSIKLNEIKTIHDFNDFIKSFEDGSYYLDNFRFTKENDEIIFKLNFYLYSF